MVPLATRKLRLHGGFAGRGLYRGRMPEIAELHVVLGQQHASNAFALDNVVLPGLQSNLVQGGVAEGMIAELEP